MSNSASRNSSLIEDSSTVQTHALQLALKTMNERCQQLQQRLTTVEDENIRLRVKLDSDKTLKLDCAARPSDYEHLREKVEELNRQKNQLSHHINMVATENRHLWSRLSKMTKDNHSLGSQITKLSDSLEQQTSSPKPLQHHIIRSKTFTQSTPNSKLCPKIDSESDLSLEEISLKLINNFIQDKSVLEEQYEQMVEMHSDVDCDETACINLGNIGFSYITDGNEDSGFSLTQCIEGYDMIRKQILKQKNDLNKILSNLQKKNDDTICSKCKTNIDLNVTPENKRFHDFNNDTKWATPVSSTSQLLDKSIQNDVDNSLTQIRHHNLFRPISDLNLATQDLVKSNESINDSYDTMVTRVCPMCTKVFPNMSLNELTDHVETHFVGEDDTLVVESNYEIVTHSVGNF